MLRRTAVSLALALASLVGGMLASSRAVAQTIAFPSSGLQQPTRVLPNGNNIGVGPRPINLTPLGISYDDCIQDQTLQFQVVYSNFNGQAIQVWASTGGDCTQDSNRGIGLAPSCWLVATGGTGLIATTSVTPLTINVRVQDIVGWQVTPPTVPTYHALGASACNAQPAFTGVPITLYFIAELSNYIVTGSTPMQYIVNTDLVGPPAPLGLSTASGETLIVANWTPNSDSDTVGYDVYTDPPPGTTQQIGNYVCNEAGSSTETVQDSSLDADAVAEAVAEAGPVAEDAEIEESSSPAIDAAVLVDAEGDAIASIDAIAPSDASGTASSVDATTAEIADAMMPDGTGTAPACYYSYGGGLGSMTTGSCSDKNLGGSIGVDASTVTEDLDASVDIDASTDIDATTVEDTTGGGISTVNPIYLVPVSGNVGMLISSKTQGSYTITGLSDNVVYAVAVSAVDAYGNVGPPSNQWCDYPAPVNDFWQLYREAGGQAGGLCALEAVGAPVSSTVAFGAAGALCVGLVRRRRRRR
jgi:hypothetical protein